MFFLLFNFIYINNKDYAEFYKKVYDKQKKLFENPYYRKFLSRPDIKFYRKLRIRKSTIDTVRVAVLRLEFLEDSSDLTTGNGKMILYPQGNLCDTIFIGNDTIIQRNIYYDPPHDSIYFSKLMEFLHNYFLAVSGGKLFVEWKILPEKLDSSFQLPHTMLYYGDPENYVLGLFTLLRDGIVVADPYVDFSKFDKIIIFHAGSMYQTDLNGDSPYDLPAVFIDGADYLFGSPIVADGKEFTGGVIYCETGNQDNYYSFLQGGLVHEFSHAIGAIDLYDTGGNSMGIGGWALMGTGNWNEAGLIPPRHDPWHRDYFGWENTILITEDTTIDIVWVGSKDTITPKLYKIPLNDYEYFLIENRFAYMNPDTIHYVSPCTTDIDSNGFRVWKNNILVRVDDYDISLPPEINKGGLAIWHIDERKIKDSIDYNAVNSGFPKGVDLEEADGIQDFERLFDELRIVDVDAIFFGKKNDVFAKDAFLDSFTPYSDPNTDDNYDNKNYLSIYDISNSGEKMSFKVKFIKRLKNFPVKISSRPDVVSPVILDSFILIGSVDGVLRKVAFNGNVSLVFVMSDSSYTTPSIGDVNGDGIEEIVLSDVGGNLYIIDKNGNLIRKIKLKRFVSSALVIDINNDGSSEIIVGNDNSCLNIYDFKNDTLISVYLGQWVWGTPLYINGYIYTITLDGTLYKISNSGEIIWRRGNESLNLTITSPVACDIDRDGKVEVIYSSGDKNINCINEDGILKWSYKTTKPSFYSSPAFADLDRDGYPEIVFACGNIIYALTKDGVPFDRFPKTFKFSEDIQSSIITYDIDGDSIQEILFGSPDGGLYGINNLGKELFRLSSGFRVYSTPLIYINNDSILLFSFSEDGYLYGYYIGSKKNNSFSYNKIFYSLNNNAYIDIGFFGETKDINFTDIEDIIPEKEFYIYPSPVKGNKAKIRFKVLKDDNFDLELMVLSTSGKRILYEKFKSFNNINEIEVDFSGCANGIYFLQLNIKRNNEIKIYRKSFGILKGGY